MKLGILAGYSGRKFNIAMDAIKHAENLGYDSLWTARLMAPMRLPLRPGFWRKPNV